MTESSHFHFVNLPPLVQEKIFRYLTFTELSRIRSVSKDFHRLSAEQLNRAFHRTDGIIHELQRQIKMKLPRRESERHKVEFVEKRFESIDPVSSSIHYQRNSTLFPR